MAITASTNNADPIIRSITPKSRFENGLAANSTTLTFNQGDFICWDATNHILKLVAATTDAATIVGIAINAVTNGVLNGPYNGLATPGAISAFAGPVYGVVARRTLKTGDAFHDGDKVYLADGLDTQTVSVTDPGDHNYVGIFQGSTVASAAAGQQGGVLIGCRYPTATGGELQF